MRKQVQDYIFQQKIGQGAYGEVYKGYNKKTYETVAIKAISKNILKSSPQLEQLLKNEITTLQLLNSPHIVKYIKTFKSQNNFYMVYEYCNGGNLLQFMKKKGCFNEDEALNILEELIQGFKELNRHQIMHRDIKPENIFLHNGKIKLGDFGFCKAMKGEDSVTKTILGSPIYMAPQVINGHQYTIKADIWSLGVMLYEMVYGFCPFSSDSIAGIVLNLNNNQLKFPKSKTDVSDKVIKLMKQMIEKDSQKRITWQDLFKYFQKRQSEKRSNSPIRSIKAKRLSLKPNKVSGDRNKEFQIVHEKPNQTLESTRIQTAYAQPYEPNFEQLNFSDRFEFNRHINNLAKNVSFIIQKIPCTQNELNFISNVSKAHRKRIQACNLALDILIVDEKIGAKYYYFILEKVRKQQISLVSFLSSFDHSREVINSLQNGLKLIEKQLDTVRQFLEKKGIILQNTLFPQKILLKSCSLYNSRIDLWNSMLKYLNSKMVLFPQKGLNINETRTPKLRHHVSFY